MKVCDYCGEYPASVFTSEHPLCRRCYGEIRAAEMVDNACDNFAPCECHGADPVWCAEQSRWATHRLVNA